MGNLDPKEIKFDYNKQEFYNKEGEVVKKFEDHFPCKACGGPADCTDVSAYHEHYECLSCGHSFTVS